MGCLAVSFSSIAGLLLFVAFIFSQRLSQHPEVVVIFFTSMAPFAFSAYALTKLMNRQVSELRHLWFISLGSNVLIAGLAMFALGVRLGAAVYIPAILGLSIHVVAIARKQ